jgi:hypothetical protein
VSRHDGLAQVGIVLAAVWSYELLRRAIQPNWGAALVHAREIASWERAGHVRWEAPLQHAFLHAPGLVRALNVFYLAGHFVLTGFFFVWLYRRSRQGFRIFRNGFLVATALALGVHWAFPTAPPRLAGVGIVDTVRRLSGVDIGSPGSSAFSNPVAAVPSLHVGWALGLGIGLAIYARPLGWKVVGALYPLAVTLTVIVTGNHFVVDAIAGMAVMAVGLAGAKILARRGVEQSGSSPGS